MDAVSLSFGVIRHLGEQIAEVIVDAGVEMNNAMIDEYHACLDENYKSAFALLINKVHDYTYTFSAQQRLGTLPNIKAVAVMVYRRSTEIATEALHNIKREPGWNLKIFYARDEALAWLESQLAQINKDIA